MLEACSSCPVTSLELHRGIPHTEATSRAVAAYCPHLTKLTLNYDYEANDLPSRAGGVRAEVEYAAGVVSLLQLVGPRLKELGVAGSAHQWAPQCFDTLSHCTALTSLGIHVGWKKWTGARELVTYRSLGKARVRGEDYPRFNRSSWDDGL